MTRCRKTITPSKELEDEWRDEALFFGSSTALKGDDPDHPRRKEAIESYAYIIRMIWEHECECDDCMTGKVLEMLE